MPLPTLAERDKWPCARCGRPPAAHFVIVLTQPPPEMKFETHAFKPARRSA